MPYIRDEFVQTNPTLGASSAPIKTDSATMADGSAQRSNTPVLIRLFLALLILVAAILCAAYFIFNQEHVTPVERRERSVTVDLLPAQPGTYQPDWRFFGEIVAAAQFDVRPAVSGAVVQIHDQLRAGGEVKRGDVLLKIDPFNYQGALTEAEANLAEAQLATTEARARLDVEKINVESAKAQLELAKRDVERAQRLNQRGAFTDQEVEERQLVVLQRAQALAQSESNLSVLGAQVEQRQAAIARAEWRVAQAEKNLAQTTITAPFDGVVQSETIEVGRLVSANEVIASLFDVSELEARFVMTDKQFGELSANRLIGRAVQVRWQIEPRPVVMNAQIVRSGALVDAGRGGVDVFAAVEQDVANPLRPGTFVQIEVKGPQYQQALLLPETALYDNKFVYVRQQGRSARKQVRFIGFSGSSVVVQSDEIGAGDEIITTRLAQISEGLKVMNEQEAATARAAREMRTDQDAAAQDKPTDQAHNIDNNNKAIPAQPASNTPSSEVDS